MSKKLYAPTHNGGIRFVSHRQGHVRVPNYVYDLWLPLLGAKAIGVYSVYCRLEREGVVKALSQRDIARACRIGERTLGQINKDLRRCGFINIRKPQGHERLMHWSLEITVLDPPTEIPPEVIREYEYSDGAYSPLSTWLVQENPALPNDNAGVAEQQRDALPNSNANVEDLDVEALEVSGADAPMTSQQAFTELFGPDPPSEPDNGDGGLSPQEKHLQGVARAHNAWAERSGTRPWTGWGGSGVRARDGVSADAIRHTGWLLEQETGLHPVDGELSGWVKALTMIYQAGGGDWKVIRAGIRETWNREQRYRPGHARGFVDEVRKAAAQPAIGDGINWIGGV